MKDGVKHTLDPFGEEGEMRGGRRGEEGAMRMEGIGMKK
jgi:hypothetical protein